MATSFTRSLGNQPGVQLNPTLDNSEGFAVDAVADQMMAGVMRLPRGPIDRAFVVHKGNVLKVTGRPEPIAANALNASHTQLVEAVSKGAKRVVVSRMVGSNAKNKWIIVSNPSDTTKAFNLNFTTQDSPPSSGFLFAIRHLGCFNDGIKIAVSAKESLNGAGTKVDQSVITLKVYDYADVLLDEFTCSLDSTSVDDDGYPNHLQAFIEKYSFSDYECVLASGAKIQVNCNAYGKDSNGIQKTQTSTVLKPFTEGTVTGFTAAQYIAAVKLLRDTDMDYVYLSSFGTESATLIAQLAQLAYDKNIVCGVDVPGALTPKQAIAWVGNLGVSSHLLYLVWHPVECADPSGVSGRVTLGTSAYRNALACARNASTNQLGFARKQYVIAGRNYPIQRAGMKQFYKPDEEELSDLALAGITPVMYESFSGGASGYIFADAVTKAGKQTSYLNLLNSVEILTTVERDISRIAREFLLFYPMEEAIERAYRMCGQYLDNAESSGWLIKTGELDGNAWLLEIRKNAQRPADVMNISLRMRVEGCARQVHISPEITR